MKRKIVMLTRDQTDLARKMKVTPRTVREALLFKSNSVLAREIRERAMNEYLSKLVINPKN